MDALSYLNDLISYPSVSSSSNEAVTSHVAEILASLGFETERLDYLDEAGVAKSSVVGKRGSGTGGIGYFAHTDVVPADDWLDVESGTILAGHS